MSIVFATPLYGGNCCAEFADSMARLQSSLDLSGVKYKVLHHVNDSLIPRARNCLVARFMRDPELKDFEAFMFIDGDIQFDPEDVAKLWNLGVDVACGCYPTKKDNAETTAWKDGKLVELDKFSGPTEIDFAGTGFLMIRRPVFEKMQQAFPWTRHVEGKLGEVYGLFQDQMSDLDEVIKLTRDLVSEWKSQRDHGLRKINVGALVEQLDIVMNSDWKDRWSSSEDYTFCQRWRDLGGDIILDPSIRLGHVGRKVYR